MSQITMWEINGISIELDITDVETLSRYEAAFEQMEAESKVIPKDGKQSDQLRAACDLFYRLYDRLFGDGTSEKIHAKKYNYGECITVYNSFLSFVSEQKERNDQSMAQISKYMPQNRKQRRDAAHRP